MKFVLYKYEPGVRPPTLQYLTGILDDTPRYSKNARSARRYNFFQAIIIALRFNLSWIPEKYIPKT